MFADPNPTDLAIAGSAVAGALLDLLIKREVISAADCRTAQDWIRAKIGMRGDAASAIIDEIHRALP